jgi:aminomethyltransferase
MTKHTPLYEEHLRLGARVVEFGGWEMPLHYPTGIIAEHLATRRYGGIFDVSHMGRLFISGDGAAAFLQHVLSNDVQALQPGEAQYTIIPNESGGAIDDAYLYRIDADGSLLVVNASNAEKDREWLTHERMAFRDVVIEDRTASLAMLAVQGPAAGDLLGRIVGGTDAFRELPKNGIAEAEVLGERLLMSRTGYTGEPIGFELFLPAGIAPELFRLLTREAHKMHIVPVGLGARDTLRLEAGFPLYGGELGVDIEGREIPIFAISAARIGVSFSPLKGRFIGKEALLRQYRELRNRAGNGKPPVGRYLPRVIVPFAVSGDGIARHGFEVYADGAPVGYVTSGTAVPYWGFQGRGADARPSDNSHTRAIGLAYLDAGLKPWSRITIRVRDEMVEGAVVRAHLSSATPPYARPVLPADHLERVRP